MRTITRFSNLKILHIGGPHLTMDGLSQLRVFENLEYLNIRDIQLDIRSLERIVSQLPKLRELCVTRCRFQEEESKVFQGLRRKGVTVTIEPWKPAPDRVPGPELPEWPEPEPPGVELHRL